MKICLDVQIRKNDSIHVEDDSCNANNKNKKDISSEDKNTKDNKASSTGFNNMHLFENLDKVIGIVGATFSVLLAFRASSYKYDCENYYHIPAEYFGISNWEVIYRIVLSTLILCVIVLPFIFIEKVEKFDKCWFKTLILVLVSFCGAIVIFALAYYWPIFDCKLLVISPIIYILLFVPSYMGKGKKWHDKGCWTIGVIVIMLVLIFELISFNQPVLFYNITEETGYETVELNNQTYAVLSIYEGKYLVSPCFFSANGNEIDTTTYRLVSMDEVVIKYEQLSSPPSIITK